MSRKWYGIFLLVLAAWGSLLSGCAGKEDNTAAQQEESETSNEPAGAVLPYAESDATISEGKETVLFQQSCEGGFLALINRKTGEDLPEGWEEIPEFHNDGRYDRYESALFQVTETGKRKKIRRYRIPAAPEKQEGMEDFFSEMRPGSFCFREDGSIIAVESSYECWKEQNAQHSRDRYYVRVLESNGTEISSGEIETEGKALICREAVYLGNEILAAPNGDEILFFGTDGKKRFSVSTTFSIRELCPTEKGKAAAVLSEDGAFWISEINAIDGTVTVPLRLPDGAHDFCVSGNGRNLYYIRNSELFLFNMDSGESSRHVSLLNLGILPSSVGAFFADGEGRLHFLIHEWDSAGETIREIYRIAEPAEIKTEKQPLTVGFMDISLGMTEELLRFNEESDEVYLETIDFRNISQNAFYAASADILIMDEESYNRFSDQGSLADLSPFLDADRDYGPEMLIPAVLNALRDETGRLRHIASSFRIETMVCTLETAEKLAPLTLENLYRICAGQEDGSLVYEPVYTAERLLEDLCAVNRRKLGSGEHLDRELYSQLERISVFQPDYYSYDRYAADTSSTEKRIADGTILMMQAHIGSLEDLKWYDAFFDGNACFVGWPAEKSSFSRMRFDESVGVSSVCTEEEQAVAWKFLRGILSCADGSNQYGFPVMTDVLESEMRQDAESVSYRTDEDGQFELDKEGNKIEIPRSTWYSPEWKKHYVLALTAEQRQKLMALIADCV